METTTNNYIAVAYKLYTTENGKKKLQEEVNAPVIDYMLKKNIKLEQEIITIES